MEAVGIPVGKTSHGCSAGVCQNQGCNLLTMFVEYTSRQDAVDLWRSRPETSVAVQRPAESTCAVSAYSKCAVVKRPNPWPFVRVPLSGCLKFDKESHNLLGPRISTHTHFMVS